MSAASGGDMARCPCLSLKCGVALLTVAAAMIAQSRAIFGGSFGPVLATVLHGTASSAVLLPVIGCAGMATAGFFAALGGWRATQTHYDPFDGMALARALGGSLLLLYAINAGWGLDPYAWGPGLAAFGRGLLLAALAYNVAGLWLQLRGPLAGLMGDLRGQDEPSPRWRGGDVAAWQQAVTECHQVIAALTDERNRLAYDLAQKESGWGWPDNSAQLAILTQEVEQHRNTLASWQQAVTERDDAIAARTDERDRAEATRDRYQALGKHYKARSAQSDLVLQFPGALKALEKVVHPNAHGGASPDVLRRAHEAFCALSEIRERLEVRR
jgi:uncharacterized small protein (DUF1192 family)